MRAIAAVILIAISPLATVRAWAQQGSSEVAPASATPRQTVQTVASRISDLYFDAEVGAWIADQLNAEAAAGAFDALTDGTDLAAALTARLQPLDAHFRVVFDPRAEQGGQGPQGAPALRPAGPSPGPRSGPGSPEARSNYGFHKVEILPGNIGYIEISGFTNIDFSNADDPARRAADTALGFVAGADAVIFDLRNNGGGAPSMVGYLVSAFTPAGAQIYNVFHARQGERSEAPDVFYPAPRLTTPVYILTSARSGSAAEAFPYTMQAAGRAKVVGDVTGGAANPGGTVPIGGGFGVFISQGSPVNPITGRNWESVGVQPDVQTPWDEALTRAQQLALEGIIAADPTRVDAAWALEAMTTPAPSLDLSPYVGAYGETQVAIVDGGLQVLRGRRPPVILSALGEDQFTVVADPSRRFHFNRDDSGKVVAMDLIGAGSPPARARRTD